MRISYSIDVDCANCANLMERAVNKIPGIVSVSVNFLTQKINVELLEGVDIDKTMKAVLRACRKIEPDCDIHF